MDDHDAGAPGRQSEPEDAADAHPRGPIREYTWEGRPGEDFGPIAPPSPGPAPRERHQPIIDDDPITDRMRVGVPAGARPSETLRGVQAPPPASPPVRRRRWRPILTALGALILVGGLAAGVLTVISRQALESFTTTTTAGATPAAEVAPPSPAASSPLPAATAVPAASPAASPAPAGSPTPLALAPPTASPLPTRTPVIASRVTPVIVPGLPGLATPPGLRFATSTPARLGTPAPTRTPPPVPTSRPVTFLSRVWSDQVLHRVGDDASICGAASSGASAELTVITPGRANRTLGEFKPPSERVCYTMRLDEPGLYVLSLIVKDAGGSEIDRQSGALSAGP